MTDRELLELAAKAEGRKVWRGDSISPDRFFCECVANSGVVTGREWNPLADDGDALRLAVKLGMSIISGTYKVVCEWVPQEDDGGVIIHEQYGDDPASATRRAIVRAAAQLGEKK